MKLWLWFMKLEDGNMLWIFMLRIGSFEWIIVWWKFGIFCRIMGNVFGLYWNGLELVDKNENVDIGWKVWS